MINKTGLQGEECITKLDKLEEGTPLMIRIGSTDFKQVLYLGKKEIQGRLAYVFKDNINIFPFSFSEQFILDINNNIYFLFDCNEPCSTMSIVKDISKVNNRLTFNEAYKLALKKYGNNLGVFSRCYTKNGNVISGKYISYGLNKIITKEELLEIRN